MKTRRQHAGEEALTISRRSTRSTTSIENSVTIPIDLIIEILSRLPAESISRCRCVSKLWASILHRPDFTESFMTRSWTRPQILFSIVKNGDEVFFFSTPQVRDPDENSSLVAVNHHRMKFPPRLIQIRGPLSRYTFQIRGPLRGLVCLTHIQMISNGREKRVQVICNPSTGQAIHLPKVKTRRVNVNSYLGFDPIGKKFKLLSMTMRFNAETMSEEHQVLTLGTQKLSWRKIECCISYHYPDNYAEDGICINGGLYYVVLLNGPPNVHGIVCFDVRSEKFTLIKGADGMTLLSDSTFGNYKGRLCALLSDGVEEEINGETERVVLWVLVDAEKHEWSKHLYIVPPIWKNVVGRDKLYFVGMIDTDEIVLSRYHKSYPDPFYVYYYNIEKNTITRVEIKGMDAIKYCLVHTSLNHVEDVKLLQYI